MRIETVVQTFYQYDELPTEKAKGLAREWFREGALYYEWWDYIYDDAERVGLKITEFDLDRGAYVKAHFLSSAEETAHKIEQEHGEKCETFKDAKAYLAARDNVINQWERDENGEFVNQYRLDESLDALDTNFLRTLQEDYRIMLQKEMDYRLSDEAVDEDIRANEYEFTEEGKRA